MQPAIVCERLSRWFGARCVLRDLDLVVPMGCVYGLIGRNGAGKTSTLRMLLGLLAPSRGRAQILGEDCTRLGPATRARIGNLTETHPVYGGMRVRDFVRHQASFHARWSEAAVAAALDHFALDPAARTRDLSRGERAGLCLAVTLAPEPELVVLDDPALGLDPVARRRLLEAMVELTHRDGRTILFSSHLLDDIERVCDRIAILDRGVLRADCPVDIFRSTVKRVALHFAGSPPDCSAIPGVLATRRDGEAIELTLVATGDWRARLEALAPLRIDEQALSLDDAVIDYLGERRPVRPVAMGATS